MPVAIIPAATKTRIAQLLREDRTAAEVSRICGVSTASVTKVARDEKIDYKRTAPGAHWGKANRGRMTVDVPSLRDEIRGQMFNARWGTRMGG